MRYLKTGCCGCTLKKSTLIIGYIGIVATLLNLIANGYQLASLDSDQDMLYGEGYSKNEDSFSTIMDDKNPRRCTYNNKIHLIIFYHTWCVNVIYLPIER